MKTIADYHRNEIKRTWCPGCGNFGIESALKMVLAKRQAEPEKTFIVGGIGCGGLLPYWVNANTFVGLHGRSLPAAIGIAQVQPQSNIIVTAGDGDAYGIGLGHLAHAFRRNQKIVYLVSNNGVYGLTKGQASPTADLGATSPSTPNGTQLEPIDPILFALAMGGTFVARGFAGDIPHLTLLIEKAMEHPGFAFIDVLQPCVSYHKKMCDPSYAQSMSKLEDGDHDARDLGAAFSAARDQIAGRRNIGLFYQSKNNRANKSIGHVYAGDRAWELISGLIAPTKVF